MYKTEYEQNNETGRVLKWDAIIITVVFLAIGGFFLVKWIYGF